MLSFFCTTPIHAYRQVLSDNYPERLKRCVMFPFPWYGRAIWGVVRVFVDKRTQNKVMLLPASGLEIPADLLEHMDPKTMPTWIGGSCQPPPFNIMDTLVVVPPQSVIPTAVDTVQVTDM